MSAKFYRYLLVGLCSLGFCAPAAAELAIIAGGEDLRWQEFTSEGRLLEETGTLRRAGVIWRQPFAAEQALLEVRGSGYYGTLKYDGQACNVSNGACIPYQSHADYLGAAAEATMARLYGGGTGPEIFAGGGLDLWERDIKGDRDVAGVVEDWLVLYALGGGGFRWSYPPVRFQLRAGFKYPFYTRDTNHFYDVTVEPKGRLSGFARFNVDFRESGRLRWGIGAYYDTYRFERSDVVSIGGGRGVFQPRTEQDVFGVHLLIYLH